MRKTSFLLGSASAPVGRFLCLQNKSLELRIPIVLQEIHTRNVDATLSILLSNHLAGITRIILRDRPERRIESFGFEDCPAAFPT